MNKVRVGIVSLLGLALAWPAMAKPTAPHHQWQTAQVLTINRQDTMAFGNLEADGDALFYRIRPQRSVSATVQLSVPLEAGVQFMPRLVIYQPDTETFGPVLPMEQPPKTIASVHDSQGGKPVVDVFTQTSYRTISKVRTFFPAGKDLYLAVYNPGQTAGEFRILIDNPRAGSIALGSYPRLWWQSQMWSGWSLVSMAAPLAALLIIWLTWRLLHDHAQFHARRTAKNNLPKRKLKTRTA